MKVFERCARAGAAVLLAAAGLFLAGGAQALTRYVDASTGTNAGDCSSAGNPCKTITYAMSQASPGDPGDIVSVAAGSYNVALGEVFPITFKNGVQLLASGVSNTAVVDGTGDTGRMGFFRSQGNTSSLARIEGFTFQYGLNFDLTGGCPSSPGGALHVSNSTGKFTLTRNIFFNNEVRGYSPTGPLPASGCTASGGAIYAASSVVEITNSIFAGNIARGGNGLSHTGTLTGNENGGSAEGGALYVSGTGTVANNTFYGNTAIGGNGGTASNGIGKAGPARGGAVNAGASGSLVMWNNIFTNNSATSGSGGAGAGPSSAGAISATGADVAYNLFFGNLVDGAPSGGDTAGNPFVTGDPLFHDPPSNVRIKPGSPAIGAGTALVPTDYDGTVRPNPPAIGAFEASRVTTRTTIESSQNPSTTGQAVTFIATVSTSSFLDAVDGTVTFKEGAIELCSAVVLANGEAQCVVSSFSTGAHPITAEYAGSVAYSASTSLTLNQVVNTVGLSGTSTALTSNVNPSTVGQTVTFVATVSTASLSVVTGSVTFKDGSLILCANLPLANGVAQCPISSLSAGNHPITAQYLGNGTYSASTSPTLNQGVSGAGLVNTSTALASSANPSLLGQPVTLTATVTPATPSVVPGTVTFKEGGIVLCSNVPLASNRAQCPVPSFSAGSHAVIAEYAGSGSYLASTSPVLTQGVNVPIASGAPRLFGISTRANVLTGDTVMIGGFIIDGAVPKTVVIRARGPSLGIAGALANPTVTVVPAAGGANLFNDDWQTADNAAQLQASGFAPGDPKESAVLATLDAGAYTAIVSGVAGTTGVGLVEVYEIDHPDTPAIGISTRGLVQTQDRVMIGGFIIQGDGPLTVVVRARGPSLGIDGTLTDPVLTVVPASGGPTRTNNDWQTDSNALQLHASGFAPSHPWESAMLLTLNPGAYTAIVSGSGGSTGLALVEVYVVD